MRPAGRGELDSLCFAYPQFAPPERGSSFSLEAPVAIVGVGPVGLAAALTLARFGVPSVIACLAANTARSMGVEDVAYLEGGMKSWIANGGKIS